MSGVHLPKPRREAILRVSADFLVELLKAGTPRLARVVANPLPADATVARIGHDEFGDLLIVLRSETFAPVPDYEQRLTLPTPAVRVEYAADLATEARAAADDLPVDADGLTADLLRRLADALEPTAPVKLW